MAELKVGLSDGDKREIMEGTAALVAEVVSSSMEATLGRLRLKSSKEAGDELLTIKSASALYPAYSPYIIRQMCTSRDGALHGKSKPINDAPNAKLVFHRKDFEAAIAGKGSDKRGE